MKKEFVLLLITALMLNVQAGKKMVVPKDAKNIRTALERAEAGDTVYVLNGVYHESIVLADGVVLLGESVSGTIIRGSGSGTVVKGADKAIIRNFTIENGEKGILCANVSMTIEHNIVRDNKGTGIHCLVTLPTVRNNVVYRNRWTGIFCETTRSLNTIVEHNVLAENNYCGVMLAGNSEIVLQNNVFIGNKKYGIFVSEGARKSRIVYNDFYLNRDGYNSFAQVDQTNIQVDPLYVTAGGSLSTADFFGSPAVVLKNHGKDGKNIGLISEDEMVRRSHDADNDGIPDDIDKCPSIPEDIDGFQDDDGCPDFDNDNDGIYDAQDKCPNEAEDFDGFEDKDGCPDYDNDRDGVPDSIDVCPNAPETINGYKDDDGCPDETPVEGSKGSGAQNPPAAATAPAAPAVKTATPAGAKSVQPAVKKAADAGKPVAPATKPADSAKKTAPK
jgi:OmpA-OmpF porin, OOP family